MLDLGPSRNIFSEIIFLFLLQCHQLTILLNIFCFNDLVVDFLFFLDSVTPVLVDEMDTGLADDALIVPSNFDDHHSNMIVSL